MGDWTEDSLVEFEVNEFAKQLEMETSMDTRAVTNAIEKLIEIKLVERIGGLPLSQGEVKEELEEAKETVVKALGEPDSLIRDTPALKFPKFNRDPLF